MSRTTNATRSLGLFTIAALGLLAVAACSSAPQDPKLDTGCSEANPCITTKKDASAPKDNSPAPTPSGAPAPAPTPPASDAGAGVDSARPPLPTHYCADLTGCCNTLANNIEKYACVGTVIANKEPLCLKELALCSVGGIGGTPCSNLNKCCDQMQAEGYSGDAAACRGHNTGNASTCSGWLSQYRNAAWCN